ncbi:3-hydroxyacyl-ACP dehydratase FabZ [Pseudoroseicyclus aestuarii]|uniref:3-hydroxyacyl-[acyl-carrier-protein] dehydratase FabZ n=1 Tax=Pseudoroseicyclus aestuarii TaxID=1795041 RepID=A0A318SXV3_9RHOB|nr:3-hydroxyacyl-ACP dehydratase FabZ [Pseudoroseicyclus aestuarii]PYE86212.1 3-hydroxyacyl-[acyl-carrier-protein] dehydratase [Pseudoroseicyclus aestuarii]
MTDTDTADAASITEADIQLIQRILPHRYPFLLVDRVTKIDGLKSAVGIKNVTMNEPHFQGHFPGQPIMPGVTIIEAMAQTAGVMCACAMNKIDGDLMIYFMNIDNCKFRRKVVPGDQLEMHVEVMRGRPGGRVWRFRGTGYVDGEVAAEAEFAAMIDPGSAR